MSGGEEPFILVAAIDFGTTYSGYGFSFKDKQDDIQMAKNWGAEVGQQSYKTPTSLLVDKTGKFKAFGYAAEQEYGSSISPDTDDTEVVESDDDESLVTDLHLFKHFKMDLHGKEKLDRNVRVMATDKKFSLPAVDVFGMALKFLQEHLVKAVGATIKSKLKATDIRWVLTVPAIWSEVAKSFMKEAAVKGELVESVKSSNLVIALEPEAASLFCRTKDVSHFADSDRIKKEKLEKGDKYMVVDAGGGTMDITVHVVQGDDKVKELHRATGGPWGGIYVDRELAALYDDLFGKEVMGNFRLTHPNQWMNMMLDWETKKKATDPEKGKAVNLTINAILSDFYTEKTEKTIKETIAEKREELGIKFANGFLKIEKATVQKLFAKVMDPTMEHLHNLLKNPRVQDLKCIFVVGGFGESKFLQHRIKSELQSSDRVVLIPLDAGLCVIKGAVLFGHSPHAISSRIARHTYCFRTTRPYKKGDNPDQLIDDGADGVKRIRYLRPLVTLDDEIEEGDEKKITTRTVAPNQPSVKFKIYTANKKEVNNPEDSDVCEIGDLVIPVPVSTSKQEVELKMQFGGTSLRFIAKHKQSGKEKSVDLEIPTE